ncbi:MAG TPA: hypothetical protein VM840_11725 [Actinomycetota bacterium]|nr:hypothetical protein [Actinomycetota bacterium]
MCRLPKVLIVAPAERHADLRRALSTIEYDITAAVEPGTETDVPADVAVAWEPDTAEIERLRGSGLKVAALGGNGGSDLDLPSDDPGAFKRRVWELLRAR